MTSTRWPWPSPRSMPGPMRSPCSCTAPRCSTRPAPRRSVYPGRGLFYERAAAAACGPGCARPTSRGARCSSRMRPGRLRPQPACGACGRNTWPPLGPGRARMRGRCGSSPWTPEDVLEAKPAAGLPRARARQSAATPLLQKAHACAHRDAGLLHETGKRAAQFSVRKSPFVECFVLYWGQKTRGKGGWRVPQNTTRKNSGALVPQRAGDRMASDGGWSSICSMR